MTGVKHLIQCHCVLPQYRNARNPVFHKFLVFSVVDDNNSVVPKYVECNNCGAIHKVVEIGRSELAVGKEDVAALMTKEDMKFNLPASVVSILETYSCDIPTWEEAQFYIDNALWGSEIVLKRETLGDAVQGKVLRLLSPTQMKIEAFARDEYLK